MPAPSLWSGNGECHRCTARRFSGYWPLRTALIKDGIMYVQAGAGIVADSDPKFEQQECISKAKALFGAAEEAQRFASAARRGQ